MAKVGWSGHTGRRVQGTGPRDARIVILGEAPGREEEIEGVPFIGDSGRFLWETLRELGVERRHVRVENVVEVRPQNNSLLTISPTVMAKHQAGCIERLGKLQPNVIVPMGNLALNTLRGNPLPVTKKGVWKKQQQEGIINWVDKITNWRGSFFRGVTGTKVIPTFHPAFILRAHHAWPVWREDWTKRIIPDSQFPQLRKDKVSVNIAPTATEKRDFLARLTADAIVAVDIETAGTHIRCVGFAVDDWDAVVVKGSDRAFIQAVLESPAAKTFHFGVFDTYVLKRAGYTITKWKWDCLPGDTEVLTLLGWKRLDALELHEKIVQWHPTGRLDYAPAVPRKMWYEGDLVHFKSTQHDCAYTPNHRMPVCWQSTGALSTRTAAAAAQLVAFRLPVGGTLVGGEWNPPWIRLFAAIHADAHFQGRFAVFDLQKARKVERLLMLCAALGVEVREWKPRHTGGRRLALCGAVITEIRRHNPKGGYGPWVIELAAEARAALLDEVSYWDGTRYETYQTFCSSQRRSVEWIGTLAHLCGKSANVHEREVSIRNRSYIHLRSKTAVSSRAWMNWVYCVTVPSGYFLARANGHVFVTGNSRDLHHLLDPSDKHTLAYCASRDLRVQFWKDEAKDEGKAYTKKFTSDMERLMDYCGLDVAYTRAITGLYIDRVEQAGLMDVYRQHYRKVNAAIGELSLTGMRVDRGVWASKRQECVEKLAELRVTLRALAGEDLIAKKGLSRPKVAKYFYETLKCKPFTKRKTGNVTTDEIALRKLMLKYPKAIPGAQATLGYAHYGKKVGWFDCKLTSDDRFMSLYKLVPITGRCASSKTPDDYGNNGQNADRTLRDVFIAEPGHLIGKWDLSQAESRIVDGESGNKRALELARTPPWELDQHRLMASEVLECSMEAVGKEDRDVVGKKGRHAVNYGEGGFRMADDLLKETESRIVRTPEECQEIIDKIIQRRGYIAEWQAWKRQQMLEQGRLVNSWGRHLLFPWRRFRLTQDDFKQGYAWGPQGEVGCLLNQCGLLPARKVIRDEGLDARIIQQEHDALAVSGTIEALWRVHEVIRETLQAPRQYLGVNGPWELVMPTGLKIGRTLAGKHEWKQLPSRKEFVTKAKEVLHDG